MPKRALAALPLHISESPGGVIERLARALRQCILDRQLGPSSPLPASRALAAQLRVSRSTVVAAYEQLLAEGYLYARSGAGTYVSADLPLAPIRAVANKAPAIPNTSAAPLLSEHALQALRLAPRWTQFEQQPFAIGCTWMDATLRTRLGQAFANAAQQPLGYGNPQGELALREALASYLGASRGVRCQAAQIVLTSGAQSAVRLALRVLLDPGSEVLIEDPCYALTPVLLADARLLARPIAVDAQGIDIERAERAWPKAAAAIVTPSHQYPLGVTLALSRRLELLNWAERRSAWIIEDDYDSEFRYTGAPITALQGLDSAGRVLYVGTLSKSMFAAMRLGYLVVPEPLRAACVASLSLSERAPASLVQLAVAEFINDGSFASHLRRARARYKSARSLLLSALHKRIPGKFEVLSPAQGMHLSIRLQHHNDCTLAKSLAAAGIMARPLSTLYQAEPAIHGLALGFTGFTDLALLHAVDVLANVLGDDV